MIKRKNIKNGHDQYLSGLKSAAQNALFLLFSFFFAFGQSTLFAGVIPTKSIEADIQYFSSKESLDKSGYFTPAINETENLDEDEKEDDCDEILKSVFCDRSARNFSCHSTSLEIHYLKQIHFVHNHSGIPLFLLHHSWKIFHS